MKNILKKISILIGLILCIGVTVGCSKEIESKSEGENKSKVVVGYDNTFVPMGFLDGNGKTTGFDVELAKEVFKRLNTDVEFQSIDWSMKETELNSGNIDVLWNGYSLTEERKKQVEYTDAYLENKQIIVTLKDSKVNSKKDLEGKSIGTQQGSAALDAIEKDTEFIDSINGKIPVLYDTFDKAFRDLEIGRTEAVVADEVLARYYMGQKGESNYKVLDDNFGEEVFVVATKKGNTELRDKINLTLNDMKKDSSFEEIYKKWFKSN